MSNENEKKPVKWIAAYCRVSTDTEQQETSFENQKSYFEREIAKVEGAKLYHIYADKGVSGTKLNRPEFNKMLEDAGLVHLAMSKRTRTGLQKGSSWEIAVGAKPKFDEIWIKNTSRFSRNVAASGLIDKLSAKGVYINFLQQGIDTRKPESIIQLQLLQVLDEHESRDKAQKVLWGQAESRRKGRIFTHPRIYGYKYIPEENRLVAIPEEAAVVKQMFEWYAEGKGFRVIMNLLRAKGIKTREGKDFGKTAVTHIINNEKYAGLNNSGKYTSGLVFVDKHSPTVKQEYEVKQTDRIEPIISLNLFNQCRAIAQAKTDVYNQRGINKGFRKYSGIVYCAKCGRAYIGNVDRGRYYYNCKTKKNYGTKACDNLNINEERLDHYFTWLYQNYQSAISYFAQMDNNMNAMKMADVCYKIMNYREDGNTAQQLKEAEEKFNKALSLYLTMRGAAANIAQKQVKELEQQVNELQSRLDNNTSEKEALYREVLTLYYTIERNLTIMMQQPKDVKSMIENHIARVYVDGNFVWCIFKGTRNDVSTGDDPTDTSPEWWESAKEESRFSWENIYKTLDKAGNIQQMNPNMPKGEGYILSPKDDKTGRYLIEEVLERIPTVLKTEVKQQIYSGLTDEPSGDSTANIMLD